MQLLIIFREVKLHAFTERIVFAAEMAVFWHLNPDI